MIGVGNQQSFGFVIFSLKTKGRRKENALHYVPIKGGEWFLLGLRESDIRTWAWGGLKDFVYSEEGPQERGVHAPWVVFGSQTHFFCLLVMFILCRVSLFFFTLSDVQVCTSKRRPSPLHHATCQKGPQFHLQNQPFYANSIQDSYVNRASQKSNMEISLYWHTIIWRFYCDYP